MKKVHCIGEVGYWAFYEGTWPEYKDRPAQQVFTFGPRDEGYESRSDEWYATIEHAMAAAIAEKHTGKRGAGGEGVGTAADWFIKMIGAWPSES